MNAIHYSDCCVQFLSRNIAQLRTFHVSATSTLQSATRRGDGGCDVDSTRLRRRSDVDADQIVPCRVLDGRSVGVRRGTHGSDCHVTRRKLASFVTMLACPVSSSSSGSGSGRGGIDVESCQPTIITSHAIIGCAATDVVTNAARFRSKKEEV